MKKLVKLFFALIIVTSANLVSADNFEVQEELTFKTEINYYLASGDVNNEVTETSSGETQEEVSEENSGSGETIKEGDTETSSGETQEEVSEENSGSGETIKEGDTETSSGELSEDEMRQKEEENERITKNINNLIIESYKAKFSRIINALSYNIKDRPKEERLQIFSTLLYTVNEKIELINSGKVSVSKNKKIVLLGVFEFLSDSLKKEIELIAKEK